MKIHFLGKVRDQQLCNFSTASYMTYKFENGQNDHLSGVKSIQEQSCLDIL